MTSRTDARAHLSKAREFLDAAEANRGLSMHNAATSDAVIAGINAKDAICLTLTGHTAKSDNHQDAARELRGSSPVGAELAPTLSRLLRLKTKSQYQASSVAASDAAKAVEWAARLVDAASDAVSNR